MLLAVGTAFALSGVTALTWGTMGTMAKASGVNWSLFFVFMQVGFLLTALATMAFAHDAELQKEAVACGALGGVVMCIGYMCFMSAIELVGVVVAYPITCSIETILGTGLLYAVSPAANNAVLLFATVASMLAALACEAAALFQLEVDNDDVGLDPDEEVLVAAKKTGDDEYVSWTASDAERAMRMGVLRAVVAGCLISMPPALEALAASRYKMSPYAFVVMLGLVSPLTACVALPLRSLYLRRQASKSRRRHFEAKPHQFVRAAFCGITCGVFCLGGHLAAYAAGTRIGTTTSVCIGRCCPVVATLWGVCFWREARHASTTAVLLIAAMLLFYVGALVLVVFSTLVIR